MSKQFALILGVALIAVGVAKPEFNFTTLGIFRPAAPEVVVVDEPAEGDVKKDAVKVTEILKAGNKKDRKTDAVLLSTLFRDLAALIELDSDSTVVKTTKEIREANSVSGKLMNLQIKGKYDGLSEAARAVVVNAIGDKDVVLTDELRSKAVEAFNALSWACYEGSK